MSKHPVSECPTGALMRRKKAGGAGTHYFKDEPGNHLMLVNMMLARHQLCLFFAEKFGFGTRKPTQISVFELNQEEATVSADHEPQVGVVDDHFHHQEPQVCAMGDRLLPELKKEQVKEPLEPPQQELIVNFLKKQDFQKKQSVFVNSSGQDRWCNTSRKWVVPLCEELTRPRSIHRRIHVIEVFFAENPKLVMFSTHSSERIRV